MLLARQGLALRGHESGEGNLRELLQLRAEDSDTVKEWLKRSKTYLHQDIQNSGANRNPKVWNSEKFRFPIWNSDGQKQVLSENFGQCSYHQ